jgi:membrane protein implicated in regulation of membrane protease activity
VASLLGASGWVQAIVCALVSVIGVVWVQKRRAAGPKEPEHGANPNLIMDVGARVHVEQWDASGVARVMHRGTHWDAVLNQTASAPMGANAAPSNSSLNLPKSPGWYVIEAIESNRLMLRPE